MPRLAWPHLRLALVGFAVASTCSLHPALAQSPTAEARRLFEAGARAYADGQHDEAIASFEQAYAYTHRPGLLFSLAQAHRGAYESTQAAVNREAALGYYSRYLQEAPAGQNRDVASQRLEELRAEARLQASSPPATETPARSAQPATAPPAAPSTARDVPAPLTSLASATPRRIVGWALIGSGTATILAGGALGYVALQRDKEATRLDRQEPENVPEYNAAARSRDDFRLAAIVTASAGAGAAITGLLTLLLDGASSTAHQTGGGIPRAGKLNSWQPVALLGRDSFRLELSTTF